eukprot:163206-Chlamydomonas_euryale.AAC.13
MSSSQIQAPRYAKPATSIQHIMLAMSGHFAVLTSVYERNRMMPRQLPAPFQTLYLSAGYTELSRDGLLAKLTGIKPRILMRRVIA